MILDSELIESCQNVKNDAYDSQALISLIDLTLLELKATPKELNQLAENAEQHSVAAVCVLPEHLCFLPNETSFKKATVLNFPEGLCSLSSLEKQFAQIIETQSIDEIDYVFPYHTFLNHQKGEAFRHCVTIKELCLENQLTLKVILETGAFPSVDLIYEASLEILRLGADFLKTSTGKIPVGATLEAVYALCKAIQDSELKRGIKISGGIKTKQCANGYLKLIQEMLHYPIDPQWIRIGASSLLHTLTSKNE